VDRRLRGRQEALRSLDQALMLELRLHEDGWFIHGRGEVYQTLGRQDEALAEFSRAIELDAEEDSNYYYRALSYLVRNQEHDASSDLKTAIELARQRYVTGLQSWEESTLRLALYHLVAGETAEAQLLYREVLSAEAPLYSILVALHDLNHFLVLFPTHAEAKDLHALLQKSRAPIQSGQYLYWPG
jgi:tetratricopeptide (TPR) repeat protein